MKIKPMGARLLIKRAEKQDMIGLIHLPDEAKEQPNEGEILAIGTEETIFKVGDTVIFASYAGIAVDGGTMINYDDVLGICK